MQRVGGSKYELVINTGDSATSTPQKGKAGRKPFIRGKLGENTMKFNFKSMAKIGLGIRQSRMVNEMVGAYSGDRLRQRRVNMQMQYATYAIGVAKFGVFGVAYAAGDLGYRTVMHSIENQKKSREARHMRDISGIAARSQGRNDGSKL